MAEKFVNERNIRFLLYEVFDALSLIKHTGRWQGTMAFTEPHAGSSLSDITTSKDLF